jgi:hypothetical protein
MPPQDTARPTNAAWRRALQTPEALTFLGDLGPDEQGCGWLDGGCWRLADALTTLRAPEYDLAMVSDLALGFPHHVVARSRDWIVDGDGWHAPRRFLAGFRRREHLSGPAQHFLLRDLDLAQVIRDIPPPLPGASVRLAAYLRRCFPAAMTRTAERHHNAP